MKPREGRLSGTALRERLQAFLDMHGDQMGGLKVTSIKGDVVTAHAIRCEALGLFLDLLEDRMAASTLSNQHDAIAVFLHAALHGGGTDDVSRSTNAARRLDVLHEGRGYELKTTRGIDAGGAGAFAGTWFDEMITNASVKPAWWLAFFLERPDPNIEIGSACRYYLVVVEVDAVRVAKDCIGRDALVQDVTDVVQNVEDEVIDEDDVDEGILMPVRNILIVEKLRDEKQALKAQLEARDETIREKDETIREKDETIREKDQEIERLRARFQRDG